MIKPIISFIFTQAYQRGYWTIANYLGDSDYVREGLIESQEIKVSDKVFTQNTLENLNNDLLVQLACNYLLSTKSEAKFSLATNTKNEIIKRNLCAQVITKALTHKGEHIFLKIYQDESYLPYANQSAIYINKLIELAVSSNNNNHRKSLEALIFNADQNLVSLSARNVKAIFEYASSGPALGMRKTILENKLLFKQLLDADEDKSALFGELIKIINSDLIKIWQAYPVEFEQFKQYLEMIPNDDITKEIFDKFFSLIEHPTTRSIFNDTLIEKMLSRAIASENAQPVKNSNSAKFISNIIEYYYSDLSVMSLKKLFKHLLKNKNLDDLLKLEKYKQYGVAFDHDLYVSAFELAIEKNSKHVDVLMNHLYYYNLDFDHQIDLLTYLIKQNKYTNIFEKFSSPEFFQCFTNTEYKDICKVIASTRTIKLMNEDEKALFKKWVVLFLSNHYIKNQPIQKFIDLDALIQGDSIDSFDKIKNLIVSLNKPEDIIKYANKYPSKQTHAIMALHFILNQEIIDKEERAITAQLGNDESAQDKKLVLKSQTMFKKVETAFQKEFNSYGNNQTARIEKIELSIKEKLLDLIRKQAKEQKSRKINPKRQDEIIAFIKKNKIDLVNADKKTTKAFREILLNISDKSQITHFETAWLSYDAGHILRRVNDVGWDAYRKFFVTPPPEFQNEHAYTTSEASQGAVKNTTGSLEVRKRACYYWLLANDPNDPKPTDSNESAKITEKNKLDARTFRIGNFFGTISAIYRTEGFGFSCCYPGHLTAIMNMGLQHEIGNPIGTIEAIENLTISVVRNHVKKILNENITWNSEQKADILSSFLVFKPDQAQENLTSNKDMVDRFDLVFKTIYKSMPILKKEVLKDLPKELQNDNQKLIECFIENAILGFSKNPFISDSITEDMLNSSCVASDFNVEDDNVFYGATSIKRQHFTNLYNCIFKEIMDAKGKMPTISQKTDISNALTEIAKVLGSTEEKDLNVLEKMTSDLEKLNIGLPVNNLVKLIQADIPDFRKSLVPISDNHTNSQEHQTIFSPFYNLFQYGVLLFSRPQNSAPKTESKLENPDISPKSTAVIFKK